MSEITLKESMPAGSYRPGVFCRLRYALQGARYRWFPPKSNAESFAEAELARIPCGDDPMQKAMNAHVLKMVRTFAREGHSGFSASYAIAQLERLLRFEPLSPLTGEDDEWNDISDMSGEPMWQNRRCGRVFKGADGRAYDIDGKVFRDADGISYTSRESRVYVTFPYTPTTEFVEAPPEDEDEDPSS